MTLTKDMENVLGSQWNVPTLGEGVKSLFGKTPNVLTIIKETDVINTDSILKTSKFPFCTNKIWSQKNNMQLKN